MKFPKHASAMLLLFVAISSNASENSPFDAYGKLHLSLEHLDNGQQSDRYVSNNSSRICFRGSLFADSSVKLIWQYETGIVADSSSLNFTTRDTFIGVASNYGTLFVGRHDTPFERVSREVDLFDERLGDSRNIIGSSSAGFNLRVDDSIGYKTKLGQNFEVFLQYKTDRDGDDTDLTSGNITWGSKDNLWLAVAYERHGKSLGGQLGDDEESGMRFSGSYAKNLWRTTWIAESLSNVDGFSGADRTSFALNSQFLSGKNVFKLGYAATDGTDGINEGEAQMLSLGWDRAIEPGLLVYMVTSMTLNENGAGNSMSGAGHGQQVMPRLGQDPWGVAVGVAYDF
jgi:hypothetical protein